MILQRFAKALKQQDWLTFSIELLLVVVGVLIALKVDQWQKAKEVDAQEIIFVQKLINDVKRDISGFEYSRDTLKDVSQFGYQTVALLEGEPCQSDCWPELVAVFHASQWVDPSLNMSSYEDIKRTGFPRELGVREKLTRYYDLGAQLDKISSQLPQFRELVRSKIPAKIQAHLWQHCFAFVGRRQTLIGDCEPPQIDYNSQQIISAIRDDAKIYPALNYWLSTVSIIQSALRDRVIEAQEVVKVLNDYLVYKQ